MSDKSELSKIEEEIIKTWEREKTFQKSLDRRKDSKYFSFYDGPPFASGEPHYGHLEQTTVKDAVVRYKTMQGYYVPRRTGYDTHGLPIEYLVEKDLGLKSKQDIVKFGIDKFNAACREIVFRHRQDFEAMYRRMGRWVNPKEAYATLDKNYIESVWWVFSELYKKKLIYQGFKSVAYCPRCATPLSNFEVNDGYKDDVQDPSLYVKFKLIGKNQYFLAWTTTPWSLPGNAALAVHPDETYSIVQTKNDEGKSEHLIVAKRRIEVLNSKIKIIGEKKGQELIGTKYEPLFQLPKERIKDKKNLYRIIGFKEVNVEEGTGVLHTAPAYGELDLELGNKHNLPVLHSVDENGHMRSDIGIISVKGQFFKKADEDIIANLAKRGLVYALDSSFSHTYPFCWRCETPLLYYAINTWFVKVTATGDELLKTANKTNWIPAHVKQGRFINWLEGARDWAISRNRFWGTPLPVWRTDDGECVAIGSIEELRKRAINPEKIDDLHRPSIDGVIIKTDSGKKARRIPEVFDCWFESGSMPYAQDHYPFENIQFFEKSFPADFVVEATEQVHLWFYTLHVLATSLKKEPAYKNVIADGLILAADGKKLSKRLRNYPPID